MRIQVVRLIRQARPGRGHRPGADLEPEFRAITKRRSFGLVFERHQPEAVELVGRPVRKGDKVHILPPRRSRSRVDQRLWAVTGIDGQAENRTAKLVEAGQVEEPDSATALIADLVVGAEFRDHIYPGLIETGRVQRGGDKPFHTVINAPSSAKPRRMRRSFTASALSCFNCRRQLVVFLRWCAEIWADCDSAAAFADGPSVGSVRADHAENTPAVRPAARPSAVSSTGINVR